MDNKIDKVLNLLVKNIKIAFEKCQYEKTIKLIETYASIMYLYNQVYTNFEIEEMFYATVNKMYKKSDLTKEELDKTRIVFYDGFGLDNRGLIQIYLKALCNKYNVIYITDVSRKSKINNIEKIVKDSSGEIYYINQKKFKHGVEELISIINKIKPKNMFLYTYPDDITGIAAFEVFESIICRYQINLTDHAFWLGTKAFDYCVEFRNYGASITNQYRGIEKKYILKLPFYPNIDYEQEFLGYPTENEKFEKKFVFSGGALYKTFGENNKYYKMIEKLLEKYPDLFFWYAGNGKDEEIKKLIKKYPERVFFTEERKDLYQILQRSFFYLSTYPICGGLMFQYAARAQKLPITLKHDDITDEFLLNQENLNVIFDSEDDMFEEIDKIYMDIEYRKTKEVEIFSSVISEEEFKENLYKLLEKHITQYNIEYKDIDVSSFKEVYKSNIKVLDIYKLFFEKNKFVLLKEFPVITIYGLVIKIINKIKSKRRI